MLVHILCNIIRCWSRFCWC